MKGRKQISVHVKRVIAGYFFGLFLAWLFYFGVLDMLLRPDSLARDLAFSFNKEWYLNSFFDRLNRNSVAHNVDGIVIVDIADNSFTRSFFAQVVSKVAAQHPKAIGIDVLFESEANHPSIQNQQLLDTLRQLKDSVPIVVAAYMEPSGHVVHSYFTEQLGLRYGYINQNGFTDYTPYYHNEKELPRLATAIAQSAGLTMQQVPDSFFVNYRAKLFATKEAIDSTSNLDYLLADIGPNDIVLIGQKNTPIDIIFTPFAVNDGWCQLSGIECVAYQLSSLIATTNGQHSEVQLPYQRLSSFLNWTVVLVISFLFYLGVIAITVLCKVMIRVVCALLLLWQPQWEKVVSTIESALADVLLDPIVLFLCEYGVVRFFFYVTEQYQYVPDILFFFVLVITLAIGYKLAEKICYQKEWKTRR